MVKSSRAIVYIDGENFLHRVEEFLRDAHLIDKKEQITSLELSNFVHSILSEYSDLEIRYYGTKIRTRDIADSAVLEQAKSMVESQRRLKRSLENQSITFVVAGSLRVRETTCRRCKKTSLIFKEKGVDVRCAVDIVQDAGAGVHQFILSSDSDLLPAMRVARSKDSHIVYIHSSSAPNYAMIKSSSETRVYTAAQVLTMYRSGKI